MIDRFRCWLEDLERRGIVKSRDDVIHSLIVLGCLLIAAGVVLLAWTFRQ